MKAVNRILSVASDDTTALHCKVICLIQLSKFEEAAKFIEKNKLTSLIFEKAYCARKEAVDVLLSLDEAKYKPGIVSALVTLYLGLNNKPAASELLKEAVDWYKKNNVSSADLSDMWRQAAEFHLRGGATRNSCQFFEELLKLKPNDVKAAKKSANAKIDQSPSTPVAERKKNRSRKRKGKLPKNFNAEVPPDPERWLPKYERTGFRKKRDRRAKDIIKGSQGMTTQAADQ
ncbi:Signal recognition particle subunit SRP72 [Eumeta japonica]|uniref:Signal recognition particle subunit SRP72 n=1 Tax=Eumeta variegata TaxID=151549 RepID=A0A4C1TLR1_EUMVA|nr:Signal recognition particle subunit SRP72 [Eumeta japonica]